MRHEMRHATDPAREMEQQVRPHDSPAQARPIGDTGVDVGHGGDALIYEVNRLAPKRGLQPIHQMASYLLSDVDRPFADLAIESDRTLGHGRAGALAADHLYQRDHVRRIEGVADDAALGMPAAHGNVADEDARRARGKDYLGRQRAVEPLEQLDL